MQTLKKDQFINAVIAYPMSCSACARIKAPAIRAYNYTTHSTATYCLSCYGDEAVSGTFDKPQLLKGGA